MSNTGELACTYACLILNDEGIPITGDKISALVKSANVPVESYWPSLFAKLAERKNIDDLVVSVGAGGGGVAAPVTGGGAVADAAAPAAAAKEEKKEEVAEESDDENMFSLFD